MIRYLLPLLMSGILLQCPPSRQIPSFVEGNPKELSEPSKPDITTSIYHCQLVEKSFINKGGKVTDYKELYLRCSVQDYFIKICESDVTVDDLKPYINKGISVEAEVIDDGYWDHCEANLAAVQSRMGTYMVIKKIIE